jgi:hypothetical protein
MTRSEAAIWIRSLVGLEVQHLEWIVWEHWDCRRYGVKKDVCGCQARMLRFPQGRREP